MSISYLRKEAYTPDEKKYYAIYYYTYRNFQKLLKKTFPDMNKWKRLLTRGWTDHRVIYALDSDNWYSKIGHNRMLLHEVGHIEEWGEHRWLIPDLMHPSWLFRWSNKVW